MDNSSANSVSWLTPTLTTKSTEWKYITGENLIGTLFAMSYVLEIGGSQEIQGRRSGYSCSYWLSFSRSGHTWCENSEYSVLVWFFLQQNCNCEQFLLYSLRGKRFGFGGAKNRSSFSTPKPHVNAYHAGYLLCYELLYQPPQPYRLCTRTV